MTLCENFFPDFNACFSASKDFPEEALEQIPDSLITAIDAGSGVFFSEFKQSFPSLYEILTSECSDVYLLEHLSIGMGMKDLGKEYRTYCWGMKYEDTLITARIPVSDPDSNIAKSNSSPYFNCLPDEFRVFYKNMDGMSIAEGIGPNGFDLPNSLGDWRELRNYLEDLGMESTVVDSIYDDFSESDLRVFIRCNSGDLIVCDLSGNVDGLYLLRNNAYNSYEKIENSVEKLDAYFANSIKKLKQDTHFSNQNSNKTPTLVIKTQTRHPL